MAVWKKFQSECLFKGTKVYYKPESYQLNTGVDIGRIPKECLRKDGTILLEITDPCAAVGIQVYERDGVPVQTIRCYFDAKVCRTGEKVNFLRMTGIVSFHGVDKVTVD